MNRWIFMATAALLLGWATFWGISSWTLKRDVAAWFDDRRAEGWQATYQDLTVRGFPSRLDATLTGVRLYDPARSVGWEAPFFQILGLTYRPGHLILAWPDTQALTLPSGPVAIDSTGMRASLIHAADGRILRANLEADVLNIDGPNRALAFAGLRGAFTDVAAAPDLYRVGLSALALAGPDGPLTPGNAKADGMQLQAEVTFDQDWTLDALVGPRPQPERIDLRMAEYRLDGLELNVAGRLNTDVRGRASGEMTLRARNWREMLTAARDAGQIPEGLADTLDAGLALAAGLKGKPDSLDLPLTFNAGRMSLGLIPLGEAPRLRLP